MKDVMGAENEDCDGDCEHCDHHDKEMAGMKEKIGEDFEDLISKLRGRR